MDVGRLTCPSSVALNILSTLSIAVSWVAFTLCGVRKKVGEVEGNLMAEIPESVGLDYVISVE